MERIAIDPWPWSTHLGYHQGEVVAGHTRILFCAGQTATNSTGEPQHPGDLSAQLALSLDNLDAVLTQAGLTLADLVRLSIYTTDVDGLFQHYGVLTSRLAEAGAAPPTTLLGVTRLAMPTLLVELEGTAAA